MLTKTLIGAQASARRSSSPVQPAGEQTSLNSPHPHQSPLVMKFGGSSMASADNIRIAAQQIQRAQPQPLLVVVSAMGKTTNRLLESIELALHEGSESACAHFATIEDETLTTVHGLLGEPSSALLTRLENHFAEGEALLRGIGMLRECSPRSRDALLSLGERLSSILLQAYLAESRACEWFDVRTVLRTDDHFGKARPDREQLGLLARERLLPKLGSGQIIVTQGFIGATAGGLTTTLGRGGSDYSAALLGEAVAASEIQIWTDVEGVLSCDPRIHPNARPIPELSFAEAAELAAFGAKVLHPATIQPARDAGIPVSVRHTLIPDGHFSLITEWARVPRPVTALACRGPITLITIHSNRMLAQSGFLAQLFQVFARHHVSIDLIATAEVSLTLSVDADVELSPLLAELKPFAEVRVETGRAMIAVVGERIRTTRGIAARVFSALESINVELISMGANEINLSLVVTMAELHESMRRLHCALIESEPCLPIGPSGSQHEEV